MSLNTQKSNVMGRLPFIMVPLLVIVLFATSAFAAAPGITGPTFALDAAANYISQPDGMQIYSWGYGCTVAPAGYAPFTPPAGSTCGTMQVPGPTLIVTEGQTVTVTLTNSLPKVVGNTSIIFFRLQCDFVGWSHRTAGAGSGASRHGYLHIHALGSGNACLLQRHAIGPAG